MPVSIHCPPLLRGGGGCIQANIIRLQSRKTQHASMNMLIGSCFTSGLPVALSSTGLDHCLRS